MRVAGSIGLSLLLGWLPAEEPLRMSEYRLKAQYIRALITYVQWPTQQVPSERSKKTDVFLLGILGWSPFDGYLEQGLSKQTFNGKPMKIINSARVGDLIDCDAIFISGAETYRLDAILQALRGKPILTMGDSPGFATQGVLVNFFRTGSRISFEVNLPAVRAQGFFISPQALKLAKIVE